MKHDQDFTDNINRAMERKHLAGAALVAWGLDRMAEGLGEIADAIREHTKAVTTKETR